MESRDDTPVKSPFDYSNSSAVENDFDFNNNDDIEEKEQGSASQSISEASSVVALDKYDRRYSDMDYYAIMEDSGSGSMSPGDNDAEYGLSLVSLAIDVDNDGLPPSLSANIIAMLEQQSASNASTPTVSPLSPANFGFDSDGLPASLSTDIIQQNEAIMASTFAADEDGLPPSLSEKMIAMYNQQNESTVSSNFAVEEEDMSTSPPPHSAKLAPINVEVTAHETVASNEEDASPTTAKIRRILHEELDKALVVKGLAVVEGETPTSAAAVTRDVVPAAPEPPLVTIQEKEPVVTKKSNELSARIARAVGSLHMQQAKVTTKTPGKQRVFLDQETERISKIMLGAARK